MASYQKKRFSTFNNSILAFKQWLLDNDCHDICIESTGKYWVSVFNLLEDEINDVDKMIKNMISSNADFENAVPFLCTIPGVKHDSAVTIISEIGTDMSQFSSSKRLCCWASLTLGSNESAGKKKSVRITRARVCLKPAFV